MQKQNFFTKCEYNLAMQEGKVFKTRHKKALTIKGKINKLDYIKLKHFILKKVRSYKLDVCNSCN